MKILPLCCPCENKADLIKTVDGFLCVNEICVHSKSENAFSEIEGIPILISETRTDTVCRAGMSGNYVNRSLSRFNNIKKLFIGESKVTRKNCNLFVKLLKNHSKNPRVLVVGGGEEGVGTAELWNSKDIEIVSFDIYATHTTDVICDAHYMPFKANAFDGVWIQAVLEHVVEPSVVVAEIYRVLGEDGIVYAETPFMQQVHEGAYDFSRFTVLGHRYLFKNFELIELGGNKGPEIVLAWAVRYFVWALTRSRTLSRITGVGFGMLMRPFAKLMSEKSMFDASSGVFFLGRKAKGRKPTSHKELISLYRGAV